MGWVGQLGFCTGRQWLGTKIAKSSQIPLDFGML